MCITDARVRQKNKTYTRQALKLACLLPTCAFLASGCASRAAGGPPPRQPPGRMPRASADRITNRRGPEKKEPAALASVLAHHESRCLQSPAGTAAPWRPLALRRRSMQQRGAVRDDPRWAAGVAT
eukprot:scaffold132161_cov30-Tisochrysis_lutea.AAC.3